MRDPQLHYGIRSASSLDEAQARFVPADFLPGSAYSQGMQGAYVTGTAVSTAVVREAVDLMSKKEVARTDAQTSDRRFTNAVTTFVEGPGKGQPFVVIPYTGLGTQGKSGISSRFDGKFWSEQLIGRFWRTCAFIASQKPGGMEAHIRITNVAMFSRPVIDALFLHAGTGYDTVLEFEHDIEALVGGAFVGGRSSDGGLNVADAGKRSPRPRVRLPSGFWTAGVCHHGYPRGPEPGLQGTGGKEARIQGFRILPGVLR